MVYGLCVSGRIKFRMYGGATISWAWGNNGAGAREGTACSENGTLGGVSSHTVSPDDNGN